MDGHLVIHQSEAEKGSSLELSKKKFSIPGMSMDGEGVPSYVRILEWTGHQTFFLKY